ncbi:MAG: hemerythrin domain-containing protein [Burkholderiales bacterium]|nr:hemerythrin domain-containing protein [Burkholderiales bacterium]
MAEESPQLLKAEHEALRATLKRAAREEGPIATAATKVAAVAEAHFSREEKLVLPLLALLPELARGEAQADPAEAARMVDALRDAMSQMRAEHREMIEALRELARAAAAAGKTEYVAFVENLVLHVHREEQVLYPAAIVAGAHLVRLRARG